MRMCAAAAVRDVNLQRRPVQPRQAAVDVLDANAPTLGCPPLASCRRVVPTPSTIYPLPFSGVDQHLTAAVLLAQAVDESVSTSGCRMRGGRSTPSSSI
jgi:hypothetical protein